MSIELDFDSDDVYIIDNLFLEGEIKSIKDSFEENFPWYFSPKTCTEEIVKKYSDEQTFEAPQFTSVLYANNQPISELWNTTGLSYVSHKISEYLQYVLDYRRVKVNIQLAHNTDKKYNLPHLDYEEEKHLIMLYYVNSSDTPTTIFKNTKIGPPWEVEKEIESKEGRIVLFSGNKWHAGAHPKNSSYRIVANFNINFFEKMTKDNENE